ncbi:MAG: radical SAM protein [Sulfolobus sp.]
MKVALIRLPMTWYFAREVDKYGDYFVSQLYSYLTESLDNINLRVFDFWLLPNLSIRDIINFEPDYIIITDFQPNAASRFLGRFSFNVRYHLKDAKIIGYGIVSGYIKTALIQKIYDYIILGEENTLIDLIESNDPTKTSGIAFYDGSRIVVNEPLKIIDDLDKLPFPFPYHAVINEYKEVSSKREMEIMTSRGCYANCLFCHVSMARRLNKNYNWRYNSADYVVRMIENLYKNYGIKMIYFKDLDFIGNNIERVINIARLLLDKNLQIKFSFYTRSENIIKIKEYLNVLKKAGLVYCFIGVESFNESRLSRYNKAESVRDSVDAIKILISSDVLVGIGFIQLTPDTTLDEIERNISYMREIIKEKPYMFRSINKLLDSILFYYEDSPLLLYYKRNTGLLTVSHWPPEIFIIREIRQYNWPHNILLPTFKDKRAVIALALMKILAHEVIKKATQIAKIITPNKLLLDTNYKEFLKSIISWETKLNEFMLDAAMHIIKRIRELDEMKIDLDKIFKILFKETFDMIRTFYRLLPLELRDILTYRSYLTYFNILYGENIEQS